MVLTFTLAAFAALVLNYVTGGITNNLLFSVYRTSLTDPLFYLRLFTHVLGHDGISHFVGNFTLILMIGPMLEEKYGSRTLLELILITAFVTGLINVIFFPGVALLGASGVAFMMIILSSLSNMQNGKLPLTFILVAIFYIGGEILDGLFAKDNISQMAHIVGGVVGGTGGIMLAKGRKR